MAQSGNIEAQTRPALSIPKSSATVSVSPINTTTDIVVPASGFVGPVLKGHEYLNLPTFAFHIRHSSGKEVLFDLGVRKDWWNLSPHTVATVKKLIPALTVDKGITEILKDGGVDLNRISSVVISHWHFDHTGDTSLFPKSTELVFGPGFIKQFMPGWPTNPDALMLDADFEGRNVREPPFTSDFKIGDFEAYDFFGDGSFYILNVPGHAVGHISALARTTEDTFVFMGGDVCHFGGSFRPTIYNPMPEIIPAEAPLDKSRFSVPCPCSAFTACHPNPEKARTEPFYHVTKEDGGWYVEPEKAQQSIGKLEAFDADPNVFVCIAHDVGLLRVVDWFPNGTLNEWKEKGWREKSRWGFFNDLPIGGKPARDWYAPGLMRDGKVVRD
ncbi:uncharacterized protein K452DRAFT_320428 [Aplosporella prunicola CBS 121167]|uniref:Metallo-beta-lactamase domain-containing protein n=1 Tax=Aplosporella prunicola CBS 121167 TaxID=1176127 RepID=A0A6A6B7T6_9PEZI|nr:uncharacterized protein K452DRAFT_320428 [Aplosporella prunicola CBS 121167]KAF2139274.1 hypothetical protein K452DRAFT_320428 [Aplosporella prunicola CBS 121167]